MNIKIILNASSKLAKTYLQYFEELMIKHWMETGEITYYWRYIDDIIIFDQNKLNEDAITHYMNNMHKHMEFKLTMEEDNNISYLDLSVQEAITIFKWKSTENQHRWILPYISHPTIH
jgi:hypothetical protein